MSAGFWTPTDGPESHRTPRLRDVRAEQRAQQLAQAVQGYAASAMFYLGRPETDNRGELAIKKALLQLEVRRFFFRTVLAALSRESDRSDFGQMRAIQETGLQDRTREGSRLA